MAQMSKVLTLIYETPSGYDEDGFETEGTQITRDIFCFTKSTRQTEYYEGMRDGLKLELVIVVQPFEFWVEDTETGTQYKPNKLLLDGVCYRVARPYQKGFGNLELTCEEIE